MMLGLLEVEELLSPFLWSPLVLMPGRDFAEATEFTRIALLAVETDGLLLALLPSVECVEG